MQSHERNNLVGWDVLSCMWHRASDSKCPPEPLT